MDDNELINFVSKSGNYFNYGLLVPELKDVAKRLQIMTFESPDDAYLNTERLSREYNKVNKLHCFIHCLQ